MRPVPWTMMVVGGDWNNWMDMTAWEEVRRKCCTIKWVVQLGFLCIFWWMFLSFFSSVYCFLLFLFLKLNLNFKILHFSSEFQCPLKSERWKTWPSFLWNRQVREKTCGSFLFSSNNFILRSPFFFINELIFQKKNFILKSSWFKSGKEAWSFVWLLLEFNV